MIANKIKLMNSESMLLRAETIPKDKNRKIYYFDDGMCLKSPQYKLGTKILIQCCGNNNWYERSFKESMPTNKWYLQSYQSSGERNGMYRNRSTRKPHSERTKRLISIKNKGRKFTPEVNAKTGRSGEQNAFFVKQHDQITRDTISRNRKGKTVGPDNTFYGKKHTPETIALITLKGDEWRRRHLELSYKSGLKGWQKSIGAKILYGRKTSIERKVEEKIKEYGWDYNFSQILDKKYQYDFRIGKDILLEVYGDYWHGNLKIYGPERKPINEVQKAKIEQDFIKKDMQ